VSELTGKVTEVTSLARLRVATVSCLMLAPQSPKALPLREAGVGSPALARLSDYVLRSGSAPVTCWSPTTTGISTALWEEFAVTASPWLLTYAAVLAFLS